MGACTSKSGHEVDSLYKENRKPVDKHKSRNSMKNGSLKTKYDSEFPNIPCVVQNDLSDTVYTEDSHTIHALEDCINKSQQTSLDLLVKDANKNIESLTSYRKNSNTLCNSDNLETSNSKSTLCNSDNSDVCDGKVVTSDSGIVVDNIDHTDTTPQTTKDGPDLPKIHSEVVANRPNTLPLELNLEPVHSCTCSSSELTSFASNRSQAEHSTGSHSNNEGDKRRSVTSVDRSIGESSTDLDKIKLAIRQSSVSTPIEERSFGDQSDTSYEVSSAIQQPEVTTMVMNGREVVVIDSELFSQILDEIQFLKMKLSQLTEVIEHDLSQGDGATGTARENTFEEEKNTAVDAT